MVLIAAVGGDALQTLWISFKSGAIDDLLHVTLRIARQYVMLLVLVGYLVEYLSTSPTQAKDFAGCTWRTVIVICLLATYQTVFGTLINLSSQIAHDVLPPDQHMYMTESLRRLMQAATDPASTAAAATAGALAPDSAAPPTTLLSATGGLFVDGFVKIFGIVALLAHWCIQRLAVLLIALFYVLGPLALVFSIPRVSDTGTRWFSEFVTLCSWPIISALLLRVTVGIGQNVFATGGATNTVNTIALSLLSACTAIATPVLGGKFVGGSIKHAASEGFATARNLAGNAQQAKQWIGKAIKAARAAGGDPTAAASLVADAAGRAAGVAAAGPSNNPGA